MSAPVLDRPARTWDDPDGPLVEPEAPAWIDDKVRAALADLSPSIRFVLAQQGRHVSNRLADERAAAVARTEAYQAAAADFAEHLKVPPRGAGYIPRTPPAPLAAPRQSDSIPARSAA